MKLYYGLNMEKEISNKDLKKINKRVEKIKNDLYIQKIIFGNNHDYTNKEIESLVKYR